MPINRYYSDAELVVDQSLVLMESENHHLMRVVRATPGHTVEIVNGRGIVASATVRSTKSHSAELQVTAVKRQPPPAVPLILVQALPRAPRLDVIIEKATELGVTQIILFPGEKSERTALSAQQRQRCRLLAISALKQCGRLYLPELLTWPRPSQWPALIGQGFFGDVNPQAPLLWPTLSSVPPLTPIAFCVGPEAGLSVREEQQLQGSGWRGVKLHGNILRTDTAPLVALALLSHYLLAYTADWQRDDLGT